MTRVALISSALLIAGAGLVQAQSLNISSACQSALLGVVASPDASCFNFGGLAPLLTIAANTSLVPTINSWLTGVCAADPCTDSQLSEIVSNLTTGCSSDLSAFGISSSDNSTIESVVQQGYPVLRSVGCLKDSTNNTLCVTTTLDDVQDVLGTLSLTNIMTQLTNIFSGQATSLPTGIACTDCAKAAYNILKQDEPSLASSTTVTDAVESQCGSSFIDGTTPTEILEGTGSAAPTSSSTSGALTQMPRSAITGVAVSSIIAVFAAFAIFA